MYDLNGDPAYLEIPDRIMRAIVRWAKEGHWPGGFVAAVMRNDLLDAVCRADAEVALHLKGIVRFVYNQCPSQCHGSREKMEAWQKKMAEKEVTQ